MKKKKRKYKTKPTNRKTIESRTPKEYWDWVNYGIYGFK